MYFGTAWYPEHWPETRWPEDVRMMREAGMNVCRIAEFAWSSLEPLEGEYEFDWLERAIALLADNGIAVVLGTPTAAPPAWLTHHHPDTLAIEPDGRPAQHGNRCHYSPTSPTYHKYVRRIVEHMARRFGQDPRVIGWQIDNEYNRIDYSENTHRQFQHYLKEQYGSIEALNAHWHTAYWSQTYTDFDEIPLPIGPHNPGLMLAFRRFITRVWKEFQQLQIASIRMYSRPEQWITHNFMGWFDGFDHYVLCEDLDLASWDWYVGTGHHDYTRTGAAHDLTRGFKRRNFWVMETQPGSVNWAPVNNVLYRGEARCMAWHAVAHGADALLYWQWRSAPGGQEQLHGSLIGADGRPRPFYQEACQIGAELARAAGVLRDTTPRNEVAFLNSYDARWALDAQRHHRDFDPVAHLLHYYRPFASRNIGVDIVHAEADLSGYRLVVAPALFVLSEATVAQLTRFVTEQKGTLVLTVRTGQKDVHNALFPVLQPGPLREIAGAEVEEFFALDEPVPVYGEWEASLEGQGRIWAERLRPLSERTQVIARFGLANGWLDNGPAITRHPVGTDGGQVVLVGTWLSEALQDALTRWLVQAAGVTPEPIEAPPGVEVLRRYTSDGCAVTFVINHNRQEASVVLPGTGQDVLTGETCAGTVILPGYGVRVLV
ncbi:MAG: beta-galactosidase [Chloroherpetonaceae bacterium]|nr:beta-galactosidase [Chthonomonadaceae bacterium]MDW8207469.1 beta-galactosidase [Chloroherpetonaceae bacterium]